MTINSNIMLGYNDYAQHGTVYSLNNGTEVEAEFPLENALLPDLWQPVQFVRRTAPVSFTLDLGSRKALGLIAVLKHNVNFTGKWRVRLHDSQFGEGASAGNLVYDSDWHLIVPPQPGYGALKWGEFQWGDAVPEYNLAMYNRHAYMPLPKAYVARYVQIDIDAPANTDVIRFFRVWASAAYQPSVNVQYGADITIIDNTKVVESAAGVRQYGDRVQRRQLNAGFDMLPRTEMLYSIVGGVYLASGISTPMIAILEPTDPSNFYAEAVYGNLSQIDPAVYSSWLRWETTFSIEEAV